MDESPPLYGPRVTLRAPRETDKDERLALGRDPEIVRMFGGDWRNLAPLGAEEVERWYASLLARRPAGWVIEHEGRFTGSAFLHSFEHENRRARYAVGILDAGRLGQGIGTEVTRLILAHAFARLGLHRVDLRVLVYNHRAIACYEKCGFVREGVERETVLLDGQWHSDVMMSILEHEYRAARPGWGSR
jgi:RimJ/RimL family protein N-acetyltransferase